MALIEHCTKYIIHDNRILNSKINIYIIIKKSKFFRTNYTGLYMGSVARKKRVVSRSLLRAKSESANENFPLRKIFQKNGIETPQKNAFSDNF